MVGWLVGWLASVDFDVVSNVHDHLRTTKLCNDAFRSLFTETDRESVWGRGRGGRGGVRGEREGEREIERVG